MALPQSVLDLVEMHPVEDVFPPILRAGLPDIPIYTLIPEEGTDRFVEAISGSPKPFILLRQHAQIGNWGGDERFLDDVVFALHAFTQDPDGDEAGALLSEAARVVLRDAGRRNDGVPGKGTIASLRMIQRPRRVTDWATSSGPVQFADLPTGMWRYETIYAATVRRPI